jgi:hypothetical protein
MDSSLLKIAGQVASVEIVARKKSKKKKPVAKPLKKSKKRKVSQPVEEMSFQDISVPQTEYSASMDLSLSVNFEGVANSHQLMAQLKKTVIKAIESAVSQTARTFNVSPTQLRVKPLKVDMAVIDNLSLDEGMMF